MLSLLALKAIGRRRVSRSDPALAAFAGLQSLPKATALGSYSYRLSRAHDKALLAGLARAMTKTAQSTGGDFDLDFHAIMHFGDEVTLDTTTSRGASQRTESSSVVLRPRLETRSLVYANATCTKADQAGQARTGAKVPHFTEDVAGRV